MYGGWQSSTANAYPSHQKKTKKQITKIVNIWKIQGSRKTENQNICMTAKQKWQVISATTEQKQNKKYARNKQKVNWHTNIRQMNQKKNERELKKYSQIINQCRRFETSCLLILDLNTVKFNELTMSTGREFHGLTTLLK